MNGILKEELLADNYVDYGQATIAVDRAVSLYNHQRPHSSCGMLTPEAAHQQSGPLKRHWKNYYLKKEVTMT